MEDGKPPPPDSLINLQMFGNDNIIGIKLLYGCEKKLKKIYIMKKIIFDICSNVVGFFEK